MKNCEPLVFGAGVGHREHAGLVVAQLGMELVGETVARTAGAGAGRIAALRHEVLDHPVEDRAIVKSLAGQEDEIVDRARRLIGEQLQR